MKTELKLCTYTSSGTIMSEYENLLLMQESLYWGRKFNTNDEIERDTRTSEQKKFDRRRNPFDSKEDIKFAVETIKEMVNEAVT